MVSKGHHEGMSIVQVGRAVGHPHNQRGGGVVVTTWPIVATNKHLDDLKKVLFEYALPGLKRSE